MTNTSPPTEDRSVPAILRRIVADGNGWMSAGIIAEAANILSDMDLLLGMLAECFDEEETEFADIKLMRDRIAAVDSTERRGATMESAARFSGEPRGKYQVSESLMDAIYETLKFYANECSYHGERLGGVLKGCPRGPEPSAIQLVDNAQHTLDRINREVLGRTAPTKGEKA